MLRSVGIWVFNPGRKKQNQVFAFIVKRFRVFRAPLHCNNLSKNIFFIIKSRMWYVKGWMLDERSWK
ncbi:hypothetical protein, partial [Chryseobacterium indoltheticum]|uniref:hypothetical protein n=1 Tax=Chryseobacterium indoltheticum TaxID=254 RepID=UPI003F495228